MERNNIYNYETINLLSSKLEIYKWDFGKIVIESYKNECHFDVYFRDEKIASGKANDNADKTYKYCVAILVREIRNQVARLNSFLKYFE